MTITPAGAVFAPTAPYLVFPDFKAMTHLSPSPFHPLVRPLISLPSLLSPHVACTVLPQLSPQYFPCPAMALLPYWMVEILPILQAPPAPAHQTGGIFSLNASLAFCSYFHNIDQIELCTMLAWGSSLLFSLSSKLPKGRNQVIFILLFSTGPIQVPRLWEALNSIKKNVSN